LVKKRVLLIIGVVALVLAGAAVLFAKLELEAAKPLREATFRVAYMGNVLLNAVYLYAKDQGLYPETLAQLCASPYIAVSCDTLRNPYTERPLTGAYKKGEVVVSGTNEGRTLRFSIIPRDDYRVHVNLVKPDSHSEFLDEFHGLDAPSKRAYAVGHFIRETVLQALSYQSKHHPNDAVSGQWLISSLPSWLILRRDAWINEGKGQSGSREPSGWAVGAMWIEWDDLLNDFTGKTAQRVNFPSAGNFQYRLKKLPFGYIWRLGGYTAFVEAYGTGDDIVYAEPISFFGDS
jgi:hypothetical protein